jgi:hypothetical protein
LRRTLGTAASRVLLIDARRLPELDALFAALLATGPGLAVLAKDLLALVAVVVMRVRFSGRSWST